MLEEIIFIIFLIILNGFFSMTELALITVKKSKLEHDASKGSKKAKSALNLINEPNRFLSTIQIGITLIGILTGVFTGDRIADDLIEIINKIPILKNYSESISIILVVSFITYLTLVFGEIVPKRIALVYSENIAKFFAKPMTIISLIAQPVVWILSISTEIILKLLRVKPLVENITEAEIKDLINRATKTGIIEKVEKEIIERTFNLSDKKISEVMTKKDNIIWLDINEVFLQNETKILNNIHRMYPVCDKSLENVLGVIHIKEILTAFLKKETNFKLKKMLQPVVDISPDADAYHIFNEFKNKKASIAIVRDKNYSVQGLITMDDLVDELVGEIELVENYEDLIIKRKNDSWFVDGLIPLDQFVEYFKIQDVFFKNTFSETLADFIEYELTSKIKTGSKFEKYGFSFEIADMDGVKIDKILLEKL